MNSYYYGSFARYRQVGDRIRKPVEISTAQYHLAAKQQQRAMCVYINKYVQIPNDTRAFVQLSLSELCILLTLYIQPGTQSQE